MPRPFIKKRFTFFNPDENSFEAIGWGNQHYAVFETLDGYTIIKNPTDGFYEYAELSRDKSDLVPSGVRVGAVSQRPPEIEKHLRVRREAVGVKARRAIKLLGGRPRWEVRRERRREATQRAMLAGAVGVPPTDHTVGDYVGLCLLIQFPDVESTIEQVDVFDFCNREGYSNFGNNGSVYDYFYDNSNGKLRYSNVVTRYITAEHDRSYYTDSSVAYGVRVQELITEGLDCLRAQGFDFSRLSSDADGYIYALNVLYAGECVNNWSEGLWPQSWTLAAPYETPSGERFFDYQITNMGNQLSLGTFCHENGHMVCDFPDLYDYGYQSGGVGDYCLMCYGGADSNPTQVCAYLKYKAGWASRVTPIREGMTAEISAGENDFFIYAKNAKEYFIIENRQQQGRDASLSGAGLAIWHVDESGDNENEQMTSAQHYECSLEQADGRYDLEHRFNGGDGEDLFEAGRKSSFGNSTSPNSKWWDGSLSGLELSRISEAGQMMTFSFTKGEDDMNSIVGSWDVIDVDWGSTGITVKAGPFSFDEDGRWTYRYGGGRWFQVGNMVMWNFENLPDLIYSANVTANAMNGVMGYAREASEDRGCFFGLREPLPSAAPAAGEADAVIGSEVVNDSSCDPAVGPV